MTLVDILAAMGAAFLIVEKHKEAPLKYLLGWMTRFEIFSRLFSCYMCCALWMGVFVALTRSHDWRTPLATVAVTWMVVELLNAVERKT